MPGTSRPRSNPSAAHFFLIPARWKAVGLFHTPKGPPSRVSGSTTIRKIRSGVVIEGTVRFASDPGRRYSSTYRLRRTVPTPRWTFSLSNSSCPSQLSGTALATDSSLTLVSRSRDGRRRGIETVLWRSAGIAQVVGALLERGEIQMTWEVTLVRVNRS